MTETFFRWLDRMAGLPPAPGGEGTVRSLQNHWPWPAWLTLIFLAATAAFVAWCYFDERGVAGRKTRAALTVVRLMAIGIVLFMIADYVYNRQRTGLPYVVVVVDDSASMKIADRYDDPAIQSVYPTRVTAAGFEQVTRLNLAKTLLSEENGALLHGIEDRYKLKVYYLSASTRAQSGTVPEMLDNLRKLEPTGEATRLGDGIRTILNDLRGTPPTAIVLLTDGINTEGETLAEAAQYARRKGVPLFTIALGSEKPSRDLVLSDLLVGDVVFVDDVVNFEFNLTARGFPDRPVDVILREKDKKTPLAKLTVTTGKDGETQKVRLPYRPTKPGEFEYVVEVEGQPEEEQTENNRQKRLVSVRKEQIRALLVQSYPNYEFRYLKHMLERDSTIQFHTVLQEADQEYAEEDKSALRVFPVRREELFEYDVIIFGDVNPAFLSASAISNLLAFVTEKGGGLVFVSGPMYTPLAYRDTPLNSLFPIDLNGATVPPPGASIKDPIQVKPTDLGLTSPTMQLGDRLDETQQIWRRLPPLYWLLEATSVKPAAKVLAEHPTRMMPDGNKAPIFCIQWVGSGQVLFHATDETWRWRYRVGDVFFARYWVQTIRYLSRSRLLGKDRSAELTVDRRQYQQGESVRMRVRFLDERQAPAEDDGVTLVMEREGDKNRRLTLRRNATHRGVFEGVFSKPADGNYHVWVATPTMQGQPPAADFEVVAPPGEREREQTDVVELKRASVDTGGKYYTPMTANRLLDELPEGRQVPIESLPPISLWNMWPLLAALLVLLVTEWIQRKRTGML